MILGYDGDKAGMEAAYKASILLAQNDFVGGVVIFQNGQDPADYVKENRVDELKSLLLHLKYFVEFALDYIVKDNLGNYRFDINAPEEKQKILVKIEEFLSSLKPIIADAYKNYAAHLINLHPKYINTQKNSNQTRNSPKNQMVDITEILIMQGILNYPDKREIILAALDSSMFQLHKQEFEYLQNGEIEKLTSIIARTELKSLSLEEYKDQLAYFLRIFYQKQLELIMSDDNKTFKEKATAKKEFMEIERRLKSGSLIKFFKL